MSTSEKLVSAKKRKSKPKNPLDPNQVVSNWKEDELNNLVQNFGFSPDWGVHFPTPNCTALDAPPGYITLYAEFFREGNFRLPMSKFTGFYSFNSRTSGVRPCSRDAPKSLHDWKQKFF
ncbi:hypothetical protein Hanom_Chr06g00531221 [Helianthus anomalus]